MRRDILLLVGLPALLLAGCVAPTFSELSEDVFVPSCAFSTCHGNGSGELLIEPGFPIESLVDAPSDGAPGEILVVPGDPDSSYLFKKMTNADGIVDDPMPPGGAIETERINLVRAWIAAGAPE